MTPANIISIPNKTQLSNYGSKLVLVVNGPGLSDIAYASNRMARGQKPHARLVLLRPDRETVKAKRTKLTWRPWGIEAEFEFAGGPKVRQTSWVDWPFVHSAVTIAGDLAGAKMAAEGESYQAAKALVTGDKRVVVEEMEPAYKPLALEVVSSVTPDEVLLSSDGKSWTETDFAWDEETIHWRMVWDKSPARVTLSTRLGKTAEPLSGSDWNRSRRRREAVRREWERFYAEEVPDIDCPDERYRDLMQYCWYVHRSSVVEAGGLLPYPYVVPSKLTYPAWWLWDTAFHAIVDAWMRDSSLATGTLLNHAAIQTKKGCIPDAGGEFLFDTGVGRWLPPEIYDNFPPPSTGPCVNGLATWDVYEKTGDLSFLKRMYPHLAIYERWLLKEKGSDVNADLISYKNWYDVGWDDSKRWGKAGMFDEKDEVDWDLPVTPVDGNVFFLLLRETLSKTAALLGDDAASKDYAARAARTKAAIQTRMWNEDARFYFDLLSDGKMLDVWTPAGFVPMLAGLPCPDRYTMMREHLLDEKKFRCKFPLPTLALDDPHAAKRGFWRCATWPVVNWQVNEPLFDYDPEMALRLLDATVGVMTHEGHPTCREVYDPIDGSGSGAVDQGWAVMPVDLILRRVFGLRPMPDRLELRPHLPEGWNEAGVRNVSVAGTSAEVHYSGKGAALKSTVHNTGKRALRIAAGDKAITLQPGTETVLEVG